MSVSLKKMSLDVLPPPYAGTRAFIDLAKRIGGDGIEESLIGKDAPTPQKAMFGAARFVSSYLFMQFCAQVGFFYNAASAMGKGACSLYARANDVTTIYGKTRQELHDEAVQHAVCAVVDYAVKRLWIVAVAAYAVAPDLVNRTFERIDKMGMEMFLSPGRAERVSHGQPDHPGA